MSWAAGLQISHISVESPVNLEYSPSSTDAAYWSAASRPPRASNKLRKSKPKFPPSSFSFPFSTPNLSFYPEDSRSIPEPEQDLPAPLSAPPSRRMSARLRKQPTESQLSSSNLSRRSTTTFSLWPSRNAQTHSSYVSRKSASESGHDNAYFVPRSQLDAYLRNSSWLPRHSAHSTSQHSPIIPQVPDLFATQSHPVLPNIPHTPPISLFPDQHPPSIPVSPVLSSTSCIPPPYLPYSSSGPSTLDHSNSLSSAKPKVSRSKSFSRIARVLSFKSRPKTASSVSDPLPPSPGVPPSVKRKSTRDSRFKISKRRPGTAPNNSPSPDFSLRAAPYLSSAELTQSPLPEEIGIPPSASPTTPTSTPLFRREPASGAHPGRRWSLAGALMDDGVTDELIIQEVEKMRAIRREWRDSGGLSPARSQNVSSSGDTPPSASPGLLSVPLLPVDFFDGLQDDEDWDEYEDEESVFGGPPPIDSPIGGVPFPSPNTPRRLSTPWTTTRRVLLVMRELLSTEQSYLSSVRQLLSSSCHPLPPSLMLAHARELEVVSAALLESYKEDMTVWGVAKAFLIVFAGHSPLDIDQSRGYVSFLEGESIGGNGEHAFIRWSASVGQWFADASHEEDAREKPGRSKSSGPSKRLSKPRPIFTIGTSAQSSVDDLTEMGVISNRMDDESIIFSSPTLESVDVFLSAAPPRPKHQPLHPTKSLRSNPWRRSMPAVAAMNMSSTHLSTTAVTSASSSMSISGIVNSFKTKEDKNNGIVNGKKVTPVRDLAILPTQRIVRYAMLYQDLLAHTPASSAVRPLLERAVQASVRIAEKCDQAQAHGAFILQDAPP